MQNNTYEYTHRYMHKYIPTYVYTSHIYMYKVNVDKNSYISWQTNVRAHRFYANVYIIRDIDELFYS